jgi:exopolysaccharide biosynthesis polyprenyl glycosylphosphotransferase
MRLARFFGPSGVLALLVSEIFLLFSAYALAFIIVVPVDPLVFLLYNHGLLRIGIVLATLVLGFYLQDMYEDLRIRSRIALVQQVALAFGVAFIVQAVLNYVSRELLLPRWVMFTGSGLAIAAVLGWRIAYSRFLESAIHAERVLFLGASPLAREIDRRLSEKPQLGMVSIGYVGDHIGDGCDIPESLLLGPVADFRRIVEEKRPDRIIVALPNDGRSLPQADLLELKFSGIIVQDALAAYESVFERVCVRHLPATQLIFSEVLGPRPGTSFVQSVYSTAIAAVLLVVTAPVSLLVALLVKLTSPGPVLFRQKRVGLRGKIFVLYKFRSMYADAEARTGAVWASKDDPRVTPLGRWLRRFRLDELPQLVNVLKGDMAIVGPRPERPEFVQMLIEQIPYYRQRLSVKPGLTGWAQINHKYGDTLEDAVTKLEYDLYYIRHLTPTLDAYIMLHTLKVILLGKGAQ